MTIIGGITFLVMFTPETIESVLAVQKTLLLLTLIIDVWAFLAMLRNARNRPSDWGLAFMLIGLFGWAASILAMFVFPHVEPIAQLPFSFSVTALTGFAWFALVYPHESFRKRDFFALLPGLLVLVTTFVPRFLVNGFSIAQNGYIDVARNPTLAIYSMYVVLAGAIPTAGLFVRSHVERNIFSKQRLRWIAWAALFTFIGSLFANILLPNIFAFPYLDGIGPVFSMILATIIVWITSRKHYVDAVDVFGVLSGRLALAASSIFVFSFVVIVLLASSTDPFVAQTAALIASALFLFTIGPRVRKLGETIVRMPGIAQGRPLETRELVDAFAHTTGAGEVAEVLERTLAISPRPTFSSLILAENTEEETSLLVARLANERAVVTNPPTIYVIDALPYAMPDEHDTHRAAVVALAKHLNAAAIVPILHRRDIIGILALGPKRDRTGYSHNDASLLSSYARTTSPFLVRASIIDHAERMAHSLEEAVRERTDAIARMQTEERELFYDLGLRISKPLEILRERTDAAAENGCDLGVAEDALADAERAAKGLLSLAYARSSALAPEADVDVSTLARELVVQAGELASERNVLFAYDIEEDVRCLGVERNIKGALTQLVDNAFSYLSDERQKTVTITLRKSENNAIFTVEDSGIGIPGHLVENVGTPFFHVHPLSVPQGIGLGLALVKTVVAQHGGAFSLGKTEDGRTRVSIALPLV